MFASSDALAAPTLGDCSASDNPAGYAATCGTSFCTFDAGTGILSCDAQAVCSSVSVSAGIMNPVATSPTYDFVAAVDCGVLTDWCCTIDDSSNEIDGFRLRGTDQLDHLGFNACYGGTWGSATADTPPGCGGGGTLIGLFSHRVGITLTAEIFGADGDDWIIGSYLDSIALTLRGNGGEDTLYAGKESNDIVYGGLGDDHIFGFWGDDTLYGDGDGDQIYGSEGDDIIYGGPGDDFQLSAGAGDDKVFGGPGVDGINGYEGNDVLIGGAEDDFLSGGEDDDTICDEDADTILGGEDDDVLWNPNGTNVTGDAGVDVCTTPSTSCEATLASKPAVCVY